MEINSRYCTLPRKLKNKLYVILETQQKKLYLTIEIQQYKLHFTI
jgi:hypothetical protein